MRNKKCQQILSKSENKFGNWKFLKKKKLCCLCETQKKKTSEKYKWKVKTACKYIILLAKLLALLLRCSNYSDQSVQNSL